MKRNTLLALYAILLVVTALAGRLVDAAAPCGQDMSSTCTADSSIALSSFAIQEAVVLNKIRQSRLDALQRLKTRQINKAQAQLIQSHADAARAQVARAEEICAPLANGDCADKAAMLLLRQAQERIDADKAALKLYGESR